MKYNITIDLDETIVFARKMAKRVIKSSEQQTKQLAKEIGIDFKGIEDLPPTIEIFLKEELDNAKKKLNKATQEQITENITNIFNLSITETIVSKTVNKSLEHLELLSEKEETQAS